MPSALAGRTALVTGGGRGIGHAIATRFAREGATVVITGRTPRILRAACEEITRAGGRALWRRADVRDPAAVRDLAAWAADETGSIDVVVNNAGIDHEMPFLGIRAKDWQAVLDTNLTGAFLVSQCAARYMVTQGSGSIIHIASIDSKGADGPFASYVAAKTGLLGLTRAMATELAAHGIRVNCVSPGYTDTELIRDAVGGSEGYERIRKSFDRTPMRRLVRPDEVAAACLFLATEQASAITGTEVTVDCGLTANLYVQETIRPRAGNAPPSPVSRQP